MASYSAQLRAGCMGSSRQWIWVWCRKVIVMLVMVLMVIGKCSGNEPVKDCSVYHIEEDQSLHVSFTENLIIGFLHDNDYVALEGLSFEITDSKNTITVSFLNTPESQPKCFKGTSPQREKTNITYSKSVVPFEWVNITFSLSSGNISINDKNVCPNISLTDGKSTLKITAKNRAVNVVFNCAESCPIYPDSTLIEYKHRNHLNGQDIYVQKEGNNATFALNITSCSGGGQQQREDICEITNTSSIATDWKQVTFNIPEENSSEAREAILKIGNDAVWKGTIQDTINDTALQLTSSKGLLWAINCDPRDYETAGDIGTSTSESSVQTSENETTNCAADLQYSENTEKYWETISYVLIFIIIMLLIMLGIVTYCCLRMKNMVKKTTEDSESQASNKHFPLKEAAENSLTSMNSTLTPLQRSRSLSGNNLLENPPPKPFCPPPTVPQHVPEPPSLKVDSPLPKPFSEDEESDYADPREMMYPLRASRRESVNVGVPIGNMAPKSSLNNGALSASSSPAGEDGDEEDHDYDYIDHEALMRQLTKDKIEEERRKTMAEDVGELTRHESVNSLYEELKMRE